MLTVHSIAAVPSSPHAPSLTRIGVVQRKAPNSTVRRLRLEQSEKAPQVAPEQQTQSVEQVSSLTTVGFYRVADRLFVGKRPDETRFCELEQLGICHIVNLEDRLSIGRTKRDSEHKNAKRHGMEVMDMPLSPLLPLRFRNVERVIRYITNKDNQPVYVHCLFGQERALFLAGLIRIYYDGWTPEHAYREMRNHGYRPWLVPVLTTQYWRWSRSPKRRAQLQPTPQRPSRGDLPPGSTANEETHPSPPVVVSPTPTPTPGASADLSDDTFEPISRSLRRKVVGHIF